MSLRSLQGFERIKAKQIQTLTISITLTIEINHRNWNSGFTNDVLSDTSLTSSDQYVQFVKRRVRLTENDLFLQQILLLPKQTKTDLLIILLFV
jgi:hypothetical protein